MTARTRRPTRPRPAARRERGAACPAELSASLAEFSRRIRRDLDRVERQIEGVRRDAVRHWCRLVRDVSLLLGRIEVAGEREWRRSNQARLDALRALEQLEREIGTPPASRGRRARRS